MSSTESLDFAKKVIRHVWAKFIDHFDAEANVDHLYSEELIDESMMEVILNAKSKKDGNRAFLSHLRSNATIESLWKLCTLLRGTAQDHQRHGNLATLLEGKLNPQSKVPCQAVVHRVTGSESRPSSLHFSLSELTDTVISAEESAASRLGIVAALDLSTEIHLAQRRSCTGRWRANDPPHRRLHDAFLLLQSRLAKLFDKHIIGLKPYLRICRRREEWPYKKLTVKYIEKVCTFQDIFDKVRIEKFWLNTDMLRRLIVVVPDKKTRQKANQRLEAYHKLLGVFTEFVLLKCIPEDDARLKNFRSSLLPKLRITYDENYDDFTVSELLKQQEFLSRRFNIPIEIFQYVEAESTNSTLVTWALSISSEKVFTIFQRAVQEFWSLKENSVIRFEIEGILQLHLRGKDLLKLIKEALQCNYDFLSCTEHVSRQLLALVDYSYPKRRSSEPLLQDSVPLSEPGVQELTWPSDGLSSPGPIRRTVMEQHSDSKDSTDPADFVQGYSRKSTPQVSCRDDHSNDESSTSNKPHDSDLSVRSQLLSSSTEIPVDRDESLTILEGQFSGYISGVNEPLKTIQNQKVNEQDNDGRTPLHSAVDSGNVEAVKALLNLGAGPSLTKVAGKYGTPLHLAVGGAHKEIASVLLNAGCPVDVVDSSGKTALFWASSHGNIDLIHLLIRHGSKVNKQDNEGRTPLYRAAGSGNVEAVKALLNLGAGPSLTMVAGEYGTPLHQAVAKGHREIVSVLVDAGCPVDVVDSDGETALHEASLHGNVDLIHFLINHGSKVNEQENDGWTPLHWAIDSGNVEAVKALLNLGAGPSLTMVAGAYGTPLHQAVAKGHKEIVSVLLDAGCPVDVVDSVGQTALHWASRHGSVDLIHFLIRRGLKVNTQNNDGWTPLHSAAVSGNVEAVKALLNLGAGPSLTMVAGEYGTPLHLAVTKGHVEIVSVLVDAGCPVDVVDSDGETQAFMSRWL